MSEQKPQLQAIMVNQDDMRKDMFATNQKIEAFIKEIKPVLQWFQDYNSFRKVGSGWLKLFGLIGAALAGLGLLISYILKLGK